MILDRCDSAVFVLMPRRLATSLLDFPSPTNCTTWRSRQVRGSAEGCKHVGADLKVMQELLRHGSVRVTLETYTQAITPAKRAAQGAVLALFCGKTDADAQASGS